MNQCNLLHKSNHLRGILDMALLLHDESVSKSCPFHLLNIPQTPRTSKLLPATALSGTSLCLDCHNSLSTLNQKHTM